MKQLALPLKKSRENRCMTRVEVAELINVAPETLKAYENGERSVPFPIFYKLSQFLNIKI